jgi:hypothetical protein
MEKVAPGSLDNGVLDNGRLENAGLDNAKVHWMTPRVFLMGIIVSIGGLIFGYDTGMAPGTSKVKNFSA